MDRCQYHLGRWAACVVLAACCCLVLASRPDDTPKRKATDSRIHLIHSDVLYKNHKDPRAEILVGHVRLSHEGAFLVCDSAKYYREDNSFDAFGHVVMTQGDTLKLTCDSLYYDGFEMKARARSHVHLYHRETLLKTENLDYDRIYGVGMYLDGGTLYDADNVLVSDWGQYTPSVHEAFFTDNVQLTNPKFKLLSDTLYYYTDTEMARIMSPTNITSNDGTFVYGMQGTYDTKTGFTRLGNRSYVIKDMRKIVGDTLVCNKETGIDEAFGHVVITDDENQCMLTGNYCLYNESTGYAMATDSAVAMEYSSPDTLYVHGDTLKMLTFNQNTDSVYRNLLAYHRVRMYRTDVQGVCDSLVSLERDSCTYMYGQPILWNEQQQIFGEEIRIYNNDSTVDWIHVVNQAMTIERLDSVSYNQVGSREMSCYFDNGEIVRNEAHGNVYVIYFLTEDDSVQTRIGVNYTETTDLKMYLLNRKIQKIWMPAATSMMYPELKLPHDKRYLTGFAWFDYIRPVDKDDIFVWRSKDSKNMLKKTEQKIVPLQKLEGLGNVGSVGNASRGAEGEEKKDEPS